ncbi:MAG: SIMPL domain-containing protein [Chloracidobacterium sp.]|nr:SIMPL domain-containing protein [Chloracidobacterium sp.]
MRRILFTLLMVIAGCGICLAQNSGNSAYSQTGGKERAKQNERNKRTLRQEEANHATAGVFIEASVLMNLKADEYVAVFGVMQECGAAPECNQKMDATINQFAGELKRLGIGSEDIFVDFTVQNKIYGYQVSENIAKENLVGFELKKNVSIHYKNKLLLDKLVIAASKASIFDLIKVDYIVTDTASAQARLMEEAAKVIKQKAEMYEKLFGAKLLPPAQVLESKPSIYFPTEMYDSYTAHESEAITNYNFSQRYAVQGARKSRTFFFNALDADGFDQVINPVVIEPVVEFTLYLKVKYEMKQVKNK